MPTDVPKNVPSAFFSYCRADSDFALKLAEDLKAAGTDVWIDQLDIEPGTPWDAAIEEALRASPRMLVILSPVSVASTNVRDEIAYALDRQKRVIPVLYLDCEVPIRLERLQHIDFRTDYARGLRLLLKYLGADAHPSVAPPADAVAEKAKTEQAPPAPHPIPHPAIPPRLPAWAKIAAIIGCAAIAISLLYLAFSPSKKPTVETPEQQTQAPPTQPANQPPSNQPHATGENNPTGPASAQTDTSTPTKDVESKKPNGPQQAAKGSTPGSTDTSRGLTSKPAPSTVSPAASVPPGFSPELTDKYSKAQNGDSAAMVNVGFAYEKGKGAPQDYQKAAYWYRKGADAGNATGMSNLGWFYHLGNGVAQNDEQALFWTRKAADLGQAQAMNNLGVFYENGAGVNPNIQQALSWYRKSADAGNASGMTSVGWFYHLGVGVTQNDEQALFWTRKAADLGHAQAMNNMGVFYELGYGVATDTQQAISWYRKAANSGNPQAMNNLGVIYERGRSVTPDRQQAISWYRKAAQLGNQNAKNNLKRLGESP